MIDTKLCRHCNMPFDSDKLTDHESICVLGKLPEEPPPPKVPNS